MATDEDARAAARRIVEQVLASQTPAPGHEPDGGPSGPADAAVAEGVVDDALEELTGEHGVVHSERRAEELVEDATEAIAVDEGLSVDDVPDSGRARARALVAEVLAAHERAAAGPPDPPAEQREPPPDRDVSGEREASGDRVSAAEQVEDVPPASTSRLRARELVAAVLEEEERKAAEEEARREDEARTEAAAAAERARREEAERRIAEARRAEQERAAAERAERERREREREAEAERAAVAAAHERAEQAERERWADADRDAAGRTVQMSRHDAVDDVDTGPPSADALDDAPGPDRTRPVPIADLDDATAPLSVAELAASERAAAGDRAGDEPATEGEPPTGGTGLGPDAAGPSDVAIATVEPPTAMRRRATDDTQLGPTVAPDVDTTGVLEATIDVDDLPSKPRTGRWLLASILGAITLAIVFPLAIRALLQLVALS